jgi:lipopolysaccharide/colanic/teichoic acid biosynthesis glycosyltransferase
MRFGVLLDSDSKIHAGSKRDNEELLELGNAVGVSKRNTSGKSKDHAAIDISKYPHKGNRSISAWTRSVGKRIFDCGCVIASLPVLLPVLAMTALLVRLTSRGPVLFIQERVGLHGEIFRILKFRTMAHLQNKNRSAVTSSNNQRFTPIGPFLRRFKLDEAPQLFNVLKGDMSLVGPRPKMLEHVKHDLPCRPGVTGYATLTFAREEVVFSRLRKEELDSFYHDVVLPAKRRLDDQYMAEATFSSDLRLIVNTLFRRWDTEHLNELVEEYMRRLGEKDAVEQRVRKMQVIAASASGHARHNVGLTPAQGEAGTL